MGEPVSEQVVWIARQLEPLVCDRLARQHAPYSLQVPERKRQTDHAGHVQAQPPDQQHERDQVKPVHAWTPPNTGASECSTRR